MSRKTIFYTFMLVFPVLILPAAAEELTSWNAEGNARIPEVRAMIEENGWSWTAGQTTVSDFSDEEKASMLGLGVPPCPPEKWGEDLPYPPAPQPSIWDWRDMGGVTPVKNQGNCGSCWAFCATGAFESMVKIYSGVELDLSEQQGLSCNTYGYGCDGGWMNAVYYLFSTFGAVGENCMPYEADDTVPCTQNSCEVLDSLDGWVAVSNNINSLKTALQTGPVACAMYVYNDFYYYDGGCYEHGATTSVNHGVVMVGWDDDMCGGTGAWIIKNSWGPGWGIDGYGYIKYGDVNIGSYVHLISYSGTPPEPPEEPDNPNPADGATNVSTETGLSWDAATGATSYDLHFGTDPEPPELVTGLSGTQYSGLGTLDFDTTYYWQVAAINIAGSTASDIWSFITQPAPPPPPPPVNEHIVTGPGPGGSNPPLVRVFAAGDGDVPVSEFSAYGVDRFGVNIACGDIDGDDAAEIVTGPGPGRIFGPQVRAFEMGGTTVGSNGVNFMAYGTNKFGVNVACGDIDGDGFDEIVTGAGPGTVFGPHVRAFNYDGMMVEPIGRVSFLAYGTNKFGVNVACGDIDGDGVDEIVTGAGPGKVFGPHVRAFNYDGATLVRIPQVSFMAYGTNKFGVRVACADIDGDGADEILTAPGPGEMFGPHVRAWNYDGQSLSAVGAVSFMAYEYAEYGAVVSGADLDGDGFDEILTGPGPGPAFLPIVRAWNFDGTAPLEAIEDVDFNAYDSKSFGYGVNISGGVF